MLGGCWTRGRSGQHALPVSFTGCFCWQLAGPLYLSVQIYRGLGLPTARPHTSAPLHHLRCREAAQLARSLSGLHGGLPALLAATASETPAARAQLVPSAAAIASALFVAANEFAAEQEGDAALSAELLLAGGHAEYAGGRHG